MGLSVPAVHRQISGHLNNHQGLVLVVAYERGTAVGFGYGFPCSPEYWFGDLVDHVPKSARTERLMGLCELAVRPPWQARGIGTRLHSALIKAINPRWSSLPTARHSTCYSSALWATPEPGFYGELADSLQVPGADAAVDHRPEVQKPPRPGCRDGRGPWPRARPGAGRAGVPVDSTSPGQAFPGSATQTC